MSLPLSIHPTRSQPALWVGATVAAVLAWARAARAADRSLRLEAVPDDLRSLARLYGLDAVVGGFFAGPG